jgi:putative restriction endonuclease
MAGEDNVQLSANTKRARDPQFRDMVLRAYDYRCAITGYQLLLGGTAFGCEAAHVKWHAAGGPDRVDNGIALCPNMHLLFDRGCISLTDDRRILISNELSGSEDIVDGIRQLSGKKMAQPVKGSLEVDSIFIRWHREPRLGGVFRGQALPV